MVYSIEAKNEVKEFLTKRKAYVGTDGNFLYGLGTDTVTIVLANCTGKPVVAKPISYREEETSTFTHYGKEYNLNRVFEQLIEGKTQPILMNWIADQIPNIDTVDKDRLALANPDIPVLTVKEGDKYWLVDGNHRAAVAKSQGRKWIKTYNVTDEMLEKARLK